MKLLWEGEEIDNLHTIDIVIWNAGRQFLDKNEISATDPIRVTYPPGVHILHAKFVRTSRDNLQFTARDLADTCTRVLQIEIVGDEALEWKDGGLLKMLFSGRSTGEFVVDGRIKGARKGFTAVPWTRVTWTSQSFRAIGIIGVVFSLPGLLLLGHNVPLLIKDTGDFSAWAFTLLGGLATLAGGLYGHIFVDTFLTGITWLL